MAWTSIAPPSLPDLPESPTLPMINFAVPAGQPAELELETPSVVIDTFNELAPDLVLPDAPSLSYGVVPTIPEINDVAIPASPLVVMPDAPTYLTLTPVAFAGIDTHDEWLEKLDAIPTLELAAPTPFSYSPGPEYASSLLDSLKSKLLERMSSATGLDPAVEQAIWDRARSRETKTALANEADIPAT